MKRLSVLLLLPFCACASIVDGSSQQVFVNTTPAQAKCDLERKNISIARIDPTPGSAFIKKTKDDITVKCNKPGYEQTTYFLRSGSDDWTWGNIALGGLIGWGIDSAAGADNYYETPVNITLPKK